VELLHFFQRNKQIAETILAKVKDTQELRKELQNVKKLARERAKAITLRIPQLKDCKNHFDKKKEKGKGTMVFICEGQSAAGSITSCRDVNNQAVFVLKGKPLNVWDLKRDVMYKNDEMYNLMQALNVEDNTEGLRYDKVILATDADVDGMHIRNLMITYFFRFFEQLVHDGHVYVLETPLFRVRNKAETIYCYSEAERDAAVTKLGRQARDHAVQRPGRNQPERIRAIHRQGNALEQSGIRAARRVRPDLQFLHGQEHARAQRLHHGQAGRAGGGVKPSSLRMRFRAIGMPTVL
jgi:topoisomerase IV subunit B